MRLTEFGKFIRKYRISKGLILKQMADALGVGSAFLSGIETGSKPLPIDIEKKIASLFPFTKEEKQSLYQAADKTRKQVTIPVPKNSLDQRIVGSFCVNFANLTEEQKRKINQLLNRGKYVCPTK